MIEFLPDIAVENIIKNLDDISKKNFVEASVCNRVLYSKLCKFKYNVCPFCLIKQLSNPNSLLQTINDDAEFDHYDAYSCFLIKNQKLFDIEKSDNFFKLNKINDQISGTHIDDNDNEYNFDQVLNEKSLIEAWRSIILQQKNFTDDQYEEHLLVHFICNKAIKLDSPWTINHMNQTISNLASRSKYLIDPQIYTHRNFLAFGSIEDQLNFLVSVQYLYNDDIISDNFKDFTLCLAKHLIDKTINLLTDIRFSTKPTNLIKFFKHLTMLKLVCKRL